MSNEAIGILGVIALIVLIGLRVWIGAAMAVVGFLGLVIMNGWRTAMGVLVTAPFAQMDNYVTTAIPMFTLMGMIIAETNIGRYMFEFTSKFLGRRRGGVASATVAAAGLMGAVTGSDNVSSVIMSKLALPELKRLNCADSLANASVAAGAPLAILIPPSMAFIMFAMLTETSVASLFMAGIVPGIILVIAFIIAITVSCVRNPELCPRGEKFTRKEKLKALKGIIPVAILFVIVLGSIYLGICTPTEAGAFGAIGAYVIACVDKSITYKKTIKILKETVLAVGFVVFMLVGTFVLIRFITLSKLPFLITNFILALNAPPAIVIFMIAAMYVFLGMIMPQIPMMILTVPLLAPAMMAMDVSLVWFGVFLVMMMALGSISPPIGMNVFIVSGISRVSVGVIYRGVWPFIIADLAVILILCLIPSIALWLPGLM